MSKIVVIVSDMIFRTKIASTAQAVGLSIDFAESLDALKSLAQESKPGTVLVDLEQDETLVAGVLDLVSKWSPRPILFGYCPHVRQSVIEQAKQSGFDRVMTRSSFASNLPSILSELVEGQSDTGPEADDETADRS